MDNKEQLFIPASERHVNPDAPSPPQRQFQTLRRFNDKFCSSIHSMGPFLQLRSGAMFKLEHQVLKKKKKGIER